MNESDAKAALRAQGIRNPSRQLVKDWLRMQQSQEWALELPDGAQSPSGATAVETQKQPETPLVSAPNARPSSVSNLKPLLRERGELGRPAGRRKAGRPRIQAPWFQPVATVMADGTPLRQALAAVGIHGLTARQIRSLYRNSAFQALYREARRKYLSEFPSRSRPTARPKGCKGGDCLGVSLRKMLRTL